MLRFSASLASKGLPVRVTSEKDVDTLMSAFENEVRSLKLWQYYVLDATKEKDALKYAVQSGQVKSWQGPDIKGKSVVDIAKIVRSSGSIDGLEKFATRFGVRVNGGVAAGIVKAAFVNIVGDVDALTEAWGRIVDVLNVPLYVEWEEDTKVAMENVKNRLTYTRLKEGGLKMRDISAM
jgi:glycogen debranching enzyme